MATKSRKGNTASKTVRENLTLDRIRKLEKDVAADGKERLLWDEQQKGLGVRARPGRQPVFVFVYRLDGRSRRDNLGSCASITIEYARDLALEKALLVRKNIDPALEERKRTEERKALEAKDAAEAVTLGQAWSEYVTEYGEGWSGEHLRDHQKMLVAPGQDRPRSKLKTVAGPLYSLKDERVIDLPHLIPSWAKSEKHRATSAQKALRLLKAFLMHHNIQLTATLSVADKTKLKTALPKTKPKKVTLLPSQLKSWWAGTLLLPPATSAYLRFQILTGARPGEGATLDWNKIDLRWNTMTIRDKIHGERIIPLTPYVKKMLEELRDYGKVLAIKQSERGYEPMVRKKPEGNAPDYVFKAQTGGGHLTNADKSHNRVLARAGIRGDMNLHALRKTFLTLWDAMELPAGAGKQISGHSTSGDVTEAHYIERDMDTLRGLMTRYERWILGKVGVEVEAPAITNRSRKNLIAL